MKLSSSDVEALLKAVAWISSAEVAYFSRRYPQAIGWTEIWAELRQSYGPTFAEEARHRSAVVLCWRNRKTKKTKEKTLFVGTGTCPVCTASDLLVQLRSEIPAAFGLEESDSKHEIEGLSHLRNIFPVGLLGKYEVGRA